MKYLCLLFTPLILWAQSDSVQEASTLEEAMVVTATKKERKLTDLPVSATVVDQKQLKEKAVIIAGEDLLGVPGVFLRGDGAGAGALSTNIRGLTGVHGNDTFLALLDGIPFVSAHEEVLLSEIPIGATERVEIIRGPVSALYGRGALSGAVNYITRTPTSHKDLKLELRGGSFGYIHPHLSATLPLDGHNLLIDAYTEKASGWRDQTDREAANILIKDEMILTSATRLTAYANVYQSTQGVGGQIPLDATGNVLPVAGGRTGFIGRSPNEYDRQSIMAALRHHWVINDAWDLTSTVHYRDMADNNQLNFFDPFGFDPDNNVLRVNGFENDRQTRVLFVEPRISRHGEHHDLSAGLNWERVTLAETDWWTGQNGFDFDTFDYYFYEININYQTGEILNVDHPLWAERNETYHGDSTNRFSSAYLQDEWRFSNKGTLTLGLRYDVFERDTQINSDVDFDGLIDINPALADEEKHLSPKLALHYRFNPALNGYLSFGEGFNSNFGAVWQWDPSLYQRGAEVEPSVVRSIEAGAKGRSDRFTYSVTAYHMVQKDRLVFVPSPDGFGPPRASTADEFESRGVELETTVRLGQAWSLGLSYAHVDAQWRDYQVDGVDYSGNQPMGVPENTYALNLHGRLSDRARLWGAFYAYDDYFYTLDNRVSDGGHRLLDLGMSYTIPSLGAEISLVGKNVGDAHYYDFFGSTNPTTATPGLPARFLLNLAFDFGR